MKTTDNLCFSNGTEFMIWQERNCCRCTKSVWYNEKKGTYPKYKCAVQRDIELQACGMLEINERSYNAAKCAKCPYRLTERERALKNAEKRSGEPSLFDAHDFAKGESLVKQVVQERQDEPEQPTAQAKKEPSAEDWKDVERRMFDTIWQDMKPETLPESKFKRNVKRDAKIMFDTFTWGENMMIAFVPLIIANLAFLYADKVTAFCAAHKIAQTLKLSREVKALEKKYIEELRVDLDMPHILRIQNQTREFVSECGRDFNILWFQVNGELKRYNKSIQNVEMLTDAFIAILMVRFLQEHTRRMNVVVKQKMPNANNVPTNQNLIMLRKVMEEYTKGYAIDYEGNVDLCMQILRNNLHRVEYGTTSEPGK